MSLSSGRQITRFSSVRARGTGRVCNGSAMTSTTMNASPASAYGRLAAALGNEPLDESVVKRHVAPLFSRVLARNRERIYLANHSLGRPLDAMEDDVREALAAWYRDVGGAWAAWDAEMQAYRARLAQLLGASSPDRVVPKTSAGQGLRAVLNAFDGVPRVVATRGEFDSLDLILREYARRGRIALSLVEPRDDGTFAADDVERAIGEACDLVVLSSAMFQTGQLLPDVPGIVARARRAGARVLLDVYHSLGVVPMDVEGLGVDFAVGGSYKYLRGGPGACFLYVSQSVLDAGVRTLDIGWFAKERPFDYERPDPPRLAAGGDAWLESTPPVLAWYQARAGQCFTIAVGVARLREHSLRLQRALVDALEARGIAAIGGTEDRGAFVVVRRPDARAVAAALKARGVDADARGPWLRLCPDVLTTADEIERAATVLATVARGLAGAG
jgi:kynureninase